MKTLLLAPLLLACSSIHAGEPFASVRADIEKLLVDEGIPSMSVAVAHRGKVLWEEGFGWADRENRVLATEHTMYSLASISKALTATGLMTLVQAGRIDLDRPINDYLGSAKLVARVGDAREATVRRVANHTSGLPRYYQFYFTDEPYLPPSRDETILRYGNLVTMPGERIQYSNLGYGVVDYVISRVSGLAYPEFMHREVFVKLGMTRTSVGIRPGLERHHAVRYDRNGMPIPFFNFDHPGGSAVYSSAHDLVRFGMFHLKNRLPGQRAILSDASIDEMQRQTAHEKAGEVDDYSGVIDGYGIGWMVGQRPDGYRTVSHTGGMPGVVTILDLVPAEDVAVVVLINGWGTAVGAAGDAIRDAIMKVLLPKWTALPPVSYGAGATGRAIPELIGVWEGTLHTYQAALPLRMEFQSDGDVHVRVGNQLTALLNNTAFKNGWLTGSTVGDIGIEDANRHPSYRLSLSLKQRGDILNGAVTATVSGERAFAVTQWAELQRSQ